MRFFANPLFFCKKIDDEIARIRLTQLNETLELAKMKPLKTDLDRASSLNEPQDLAVLHDRFGQQMDILERTRSDLSPYSYYRDGNTHHDTETLQNGHWQVLRHAIKTAGSIIDRALVDVIEKVRLSQCKIFLITGMAGQGKTNFVCDLTENQFSVFAVPSLFIPARLLSAFAGRHKLLSHLKNIRATRKVRDFHQLFDLLNKVGFENARPFVLVIDGINEVNEVENFRNELEIFLDAICQYDFVKVVITCRKEFFDHKFVDVFELRSSDELYHVRDLQSNMSKGNRARLLSAYFRHFNIRGELMGSSEEFLRDDLILLRIFCEIHEGSDVGRVSDIFKGDIFEEYLKMKIEEFPMARQQVVVRTIYRICDVMLSTRSFSQVPLSSFGESERSIIDQLVAEDVMLRREVPVDGWSSLGCTDVSFIYDELRGGTIRSRIFRAGNWPM